MNPAKPNLWFSILSDVRKQSDTKTFRKTNENNSFRSCTWLTVMRHCSHYMCKRRCMEKPQFVGLHVFIFVREATGKQLMGNCSRMQQACGCKFTMQSWLCPSGYKMCAHVQYSHQSYLERLRVLKLPCPRLSNNRLRWSLPNVN